MKKLSTIGLLAATAFLMAAMSAHAAAPRKINYQGYLTNPAGAPLTGTYPMVFSLCDAATAGTCPWSENQSVAVDKGIFNVALGSVTPLGLSFAAPYFLDILVNGEQMSARQPLTSVGYAFMADTAALATNAATATNFTGSISGDVTGTQGATVVNSVGGRTAVQIVSGADAANSATPTNTVNTMVKRDASGNFSANTITAGNVAAGTVTANLIGNAMTATALAANGANCPAGSYPLGVDASGNAEGCTAAGGSATIVYSGGTSNAKTSVNYYSANGQSLPNIYSDSAMNVVPMACTARNLYIALYHWQVGDSGSYVVTLMLGTNGIQSEQALTCTVANSGAVDSVTKCSDTSHTVSISAGSYISIKIDGSTASYSGSNGPEMAWGFICQ